MFCTRNDVNLPSIASFMGNGYDSFLVTPGSLDWFFPHGFMKNSGFGQLYGYDKVPARIIEQSGGHGLKPRTRVQGLHLPGQSVLFPGVVGVTISAFHTAAGIVGAEHLMVRVTAGS